MSKGPSLLTHHFGGAEQTPLVQVTEPERIEWALRYAAAGFRVIPAWWITESKGCGCAAGVGCRKPGKHPIPTDWPNVATTNEAAIRRWWSDHPAANVGLAMGAGVVAVDIDNQYALEELNVRGLPQLTPTQHTGSGGWHRLYSWSGRPLKNAIRFMEGADIRTDGGFIVVAPSTNTKGAYWWEPGMAPGETPLAELPSWLADLCAVENRTPKPAVRIDDLWKGVPEGARNGRLFSYACKMRRDHRPELEIQAVVETLGSRCSPPLPAEEANLIVSSSRRYVDRREDDGLVCIDAFPDFVSMKFTPKVPIISPWLREKDLVMCHAWRGTGKTWFTVGAAYAIASGVPFMKWRVPAPRGVLLVDGEMPASDLQDRLLRLSAAHDVIPTACLRIIAHDCQDRGIPSLDSSEGQDFVERHLEGVSVIVLDSISTLFRGTGGDHEENESSSWITAQEWLLRLRRMGFTVLMLHHSGKGGAQRGTSKREDVLDTVLHFTRPPDYRDEQGARFQIKFEKARGCYGKDVEPFEVQLETQPTGAITWSYKGEGESFENQVLELCDLNLSQRDIAKELNTTQSRVARTIRTLKEERRLK